MDFILPSLFDKFKKLPERYYRQISKYFNTAKFVSHMKLRVTAVLDEKYSCQISFQDRQFNLLNDFGDEDIVMEVPNRIPPGYIHIFTPCIIRDDFVLEIADFVFQPYGKIEMINHRFGTMPNELIKCGIENFRGINAFYYKNKIISLRLSCLPKTSFFSRDVHAEQLYCVLPKKFQDIESHKWVSSPRIKLYLKMATPGAPYNR